MHFFLSLRVIEFILVILKIRVLHKPVTESVTTVAHFLTGHEQTQINQVCYFDFLGMSCNQMVYN